MSGLIGVWIGAFLTLGILSFLYKDNPVYKVCEAIFVGVSAGYWFVSLFWQNIWPKLVLNLRDAFATLAARRRDGTTRWHLPDRRRFSGS